MKMVDKECLGMNLKVEVLILVNTKMVKDMDKVNFLFQWG